VVSGANGTTAYGGGALEVIRLEEAMRIFCAMHLLFYMGYITDIILSVASLHLSGHNGNSEDELSIL